ncbi:MAG: YfdX family protein [Thermodesulfobacteriota bacterium]|nr:YfdX family protein [Thermodesulfobacteriota bacterium]
MRTRIKKNVLYVTGILVLIMTFTPLACTVNSDNGTAAAPVENTAAMEQDQVAKKRKLLFEEATAAIRETQNALKALDEKQNADALAALERASGKLTIMLGRDPELALAPSHVHTVTYDILADVDEVKKLRRKIEKALDAGRVQQARHMIRHLASETVISVTNIPLATYPEAIKEAARLIDNNKTEEAKQVLQAALNTLVITDTIIPLPVTMAEALLKEAETLTEKKDRSEDENNRLAELLKETRTKLEFAQALGYGDKDDFENLYEQIEVIEEKTAGGKSGAGFFDTIKGYLKDVVASSQPESLPEASE